MASKKKGLTAGPAVAPTKGRRVIIVHAITEFGAIPGAGFVWRSDTTSEDGDYHRVMTAEKFEEWFKKVLPLFLAEARKHRKTHVVVVMDNASYHGRILERDKMPKKSANRETLRNFFTPLGIECDKK